jgi:hypothetical protein
MPHGKRRSERLVAHRAMVALGSFARVWGTGIVAPSRAFDQLRGKPVLSWGLSAVAIRFVVTSLSETVPLHALGRAPFTPSRLPFLPTRKYYAAQRFFLPAYGLATWLLMSALGYGGARWWQRQRMQETRPAQLGDLLNIVGMGMLIPMPVLWPWDWIMIATNRFRLPEMAVSHALVELWEALLFAVGFRRILGLSKAPALVLGLALGALYSTLSAIVVR